MNQQELWELYVRKNPEFETANKVSISTSSLKKMFNQTFAQGVKHGKTIESVRPKVENNIPKTSNADYVKDLFKGVF